MSPRTFRQLLLLSLSILMASCTGRVNLWDSASDSASGDGATPGDESVEIGDPPATTENSSKTECDGTVPGDVPLMRLTEREYNNSVRDLFAGASIPERNFSGEETVGPFSANVVAAVDDLVVEQYQNAAIDVADAAVANADQLLPCGDPADEACVADYVDQLALRMFRRPMTDAEKSAWMDVYRAADEELGAPAGLRLVLEGMLQSPSFLYRASAGDRLEGATRPVALDDFEIAGRLSYFLAGTVPDDELLQAAREGRLTGDAGAAELEKQARRLLEKPSTRQHVNETLLEWLGLEALQTLKNGESIPPETVDAMHREVMAFVDHVIWEEGGSISDLLTAEYTFVDPTIAELYGVDIPADSEGMVRVEVDPDERVGLLTLPGILAAHATGTSSIFRGLFISDIFLCTPVPERPSQAVIDASLEEHPIEGYDEETPEREVARQRIEHPMCGSCHKSMESVGLVFDNYAADGRYRTEDDYGNQLHADGEIFGTRHTNGPIGSVDELAERLADSPDVEACVARNWFKYAFGRGVESTDGCTTAAMTEALRDADGDIKEMLISVVTTDAFRYRAPATTE